jgi:hypothetical protein
MKPTPTAHSDPIPKTKEELVRCFRVVDLRPNVLHPFLYTPFSGKFHLERKAGCERPWSADREARVQRYQFQFQSLAIPTSSTIVVTLVLTNLLYPPLGRFRSEREAGAERRPANRAARRHRDGPEGHRWPVPTNLFRHRLHLVGSVGLSAVRSLCEEAVLGAPGQRSESKRPRPTFVRRLPYLESARRSPRFYSLMTFDRSVETIYSSFFPLNKGASELW